MALRILRVGVGLTLVASGALMYAASWQRWAGACPWNGDESRLCTIRQDHLYDFVPPVAPWEPVGQAAQLAGWSLLALALAFALLPWVLTGRRPGVLTVPLLVVVVLALGSVGAAALASGQAGRLVEPLSGDLVLYLWFFALPAVLVRLAVDSRGWLLAAAALLVLATPLVAAFSYAIGPYDARPWMEAISGLFTAAAGLCVLGAAAFAGAGLSQSRSPSRPEYARREDLS